MRRLFALLLPALFVAVAAPAAGQVDREALRQGLVYEGLQRTSAADPCRGAYRLVISSQRGHPACTHGPDPAPPGVDVTADRQPPLFASQAALPGGTQPGLPNAPPGLPGASIAAAAQVPCFGTGSDGFRVQLLYARASDRPDGYASWLPSFQQWAARIDDVFNASAAETGGSAHVRFVHDASCVPVIPNVVLSPQGDNNIDNTINELRSRGYSRTDRKYLVWMDASVYCGIAEIWPDDAAMGNSNNGNPGIVGEIGRVDKGCWGNTNMAEAHELVHTMGGVQPTAPNATSGFHCTDEYDRLCYNDGTGFTRVVCADSSHEARLDCNHDDYFSTNPPAGSYLATHWNVARSAFLSTGAAAPPPTTTSTLPPATTTTTPPTTTQPTTTTQPSSTTTTSVTTTIPPSNQTVASPPQNFYATQPVVGKGVQLFWQRPASAGNPPFTTYRLYRGTTSSNLTPLLDLPPGGTSYIDTATTTGALYWYYLKAVNPAGESPPSNLTRMAAK